MITVYPEGRGGFRWILRDDVLVIAKSHIFVTERVATEDARAFKQAIATAPIETTTGKPWND